VQITLNEDLLTGFHFYLQLQVLKKVVTAAPSEESDEEHAEKYETRKAAAKSPVASGKPTIATNTVVPKA
jgi:hypothetical protein